MFTPSRLAIIIVLAAESADVEQNGSLLECEGDSLQNSTVLNFGWYMHECTKLPSCALIRMQ